jgi:hypothetical protein
MLTQRGAGGRIVKVCFVRRFLGCQLAMMTEVPVADCLRLTKALQRTAEGLQSVADLYDDNVGDSRTRSNWRTDEGLTGTKNAIKLT